MKLDPAWAALFCITGVVAGWTARGLLAPPVPKADRSADAPVAAVGVSPESGEAFQQVFILTASSQFGFKDIRTVGLLINEFINGSNACYVQYDTTKTETILIADSGSSSTAAQAGSGKKLENSQCVIDTGGVTAEPTGKDVRITIPITFKPAFAGTKSMLMIVSSMGGQTTGLQLRGVWRIPKSK